MDIYRERGLESKEIFDFFFKLNSEDLSPNPQRLLDYFLTYSMSMENFK